MFVGFNLFIHQRLDLKGVHVAADHQTQIIGNKIHQLFIGENTRIISKNFALCRIFNIALQRQHALLARLGHQAIEQRH